MATSWPVGGSAATYRRKLPAQTQPHEMPCSRRNAHLKRQLSPFLAFRRALQLRLWVLQGDMSSEWLPEVRGDAVRALSVLRAVQNDKRKLGTEQLCKK